MAAAEPTTLSPLFCPTCGVERRGTPCSVCGNALTAGPGGVFVYPDATGMWGGKRVALPKGCICNGCGICIAATGKCCCQ